MRRALLVRAAPVAAMLAAAVPAVTAHAASYGGVAENGFATPTLIAQSSGLGEPSIAHDSQNRLFVTGPQAIGNVNTAGGSPLFSAYDPATAVSNDNAGATWSAPVRSQACAGLSGGDTDLAIDGGDNIYETDLWLGNSCLSVSEDHGRTFTAGNPFGSELQPGDDRPWMAWDKATNQLYITYDGEDGIRAANTAPLANPALGIQTISDNVVVPESVVSSTAEPNNLRQCVCPPGGIAADNSAGPASTQSHPGRVYVSYSYQLGTAISYADVSGACPACEAGPTWTGPIAIPGTGTSHSAFENEWNFDPVKVDGNGTVYVMWAHGAGFSSSTRLARNVVIEYAYSRDGGTTWSAPLTVSTEGGTTTFPTMDVVGPGVLDLAWYGDPVETADPNNTSGSWNVYYTRVVGADTATPAFTPAVAVSGMHLGCIQAGGGASCGDRSLLDFFQLTDDACGNPNIIYTGGDVSAGVDLYFTKLSVSPCGTLAVSAPEAPLAPLLLVPAAAVALASRRRLSRVHRGG